MDPTQRTSFTASKFGKKKLYARMMTLGTSVLAPHAPFLLQQGHVKVNEVKVALRGDVIPSPELRIELLGGVAD